jgi:hypothetical protein
MDEELKRIVDKMIAAGESDDDIGLVIQNYQPTPSAPSGPNYDMASTLGGMVGGLGGFAVAGPPGAIAGAGLGGLVGEAANQYFNPVNKPTTAIDAMGRMTQAGLIQAAGEGASQGIGAALKRVAPAIMEMGLQRTRADRMKFPDTARRLVDEGIIPRQNNVQNALDATESKMLADATAFDAQRPRVAGLLGPARQAVPMGPTPVPAGGQPATLAADMTQPRLVGPVGNAEELGRRTWTPAYGGQGSGPTAVADTVSGPGIIMRPMNAPPGRGAPTSMVDPAVIAQSARASAMREGRIGGLGSEPGPEVDELDDLAAEYLRQNPRPRNLQETIEQKRAYQARAKYSSRPNAPAVTSNRLNFNAGVASANRQEAIRLNPAIEVDLKKEQDLLGALEAQKNAEARPSPGLLTGKVAALMGLRNPTMMGAGAITADRLAKMMADPKTPAAVRAAILAYYNKSGTGLNDARQTQDR